MLPALLAAKDTLMGIRGKASAEEAAYGAEAEQAGPGQGQPPGQDAVPAPGGAAQARAAGQRHDELSGSTSDRGSVTCGWCGAGVTVAARGRVQKWCSAACRHRAWEQRRAAASGLVAVEVVDRPVEVVRTVTKVKRVLVEAPRPTPGGTNRDWAQQLANLADDLDRGRIYDREVEALLPAMTALLAAFNRRDR